jgi:hypothetical protein
MTVRSRWASNPRIVLSASLRHLRGRNKALAAVYMIIFLEPKVTLGLRYLERYGATLRRCSPDGFELMASGRDSVSQPRRYKEFYNSISWYTTHLRSVKTDPQLQQQRWQPRRPCSRSQAGHRRASRRMRWLPLSRREACRDLSIPARGPAPSRCGRRPRTRPGCANEQGG